MQKPRAAFFTLGCKVNQYESFAMMRLFSDAGFEIVEPEYPAEVYVVNSCTVTATGDKKSRQVLRRFRRQAPGALLVLCGCFPQAFPRQAEEIFEADIVMGSKNRAGVLQAVTDRLSGREGRIVDIAPHAGDEPFEPLRAGDFQSRTRAFLKIEDGCERRCSYCVIPDARGPVRSKPLPDLRDELSALASSGYREVVLVGVNLSCYGSDLGLSLTDAVEAACGTPGLERIRLGSLEPELLTGEDILRWAKLSGLCPHFHLSLQSGCDATLRRMNRQYDTARYRSLTAALRRTFPGCSLTTDVMVGFPGETEEEFRSSLSFVEEIGFARAHVFVYSPRPGTPAAAMPGRADAATAALRAGRMAETAARGRETYMRDLIGTVQPVLFESRERDGLCQGYTPAYIPVRVRGEGELSGQILPVRLTGPQGEYCGGVLTAGEGQA